MTDHQTTTATNQRDLPPSLTNADPNNTMSTNNSGNTSGPRRPRSASLASERISLPYLPAFSKSATVSTTSSSSTSGSRFTTTSRAAPKPRTTRASAEVGAGEFSKPRVHPRSRRDTGGSEGSGVVEFRYYGRHGNQWLFNDFSVTESVRKGWGKVFGRDKEERDWFEKRD